MLLFLQTILTRNKIPQVFKTMSTSPLSNQFGLRLDQLKREIDHSLQDIRQHIEELEEAEKRSLGLDDNKSTDGNFADLLSESLKNRGSE